METALIVLRQIAIMFLLALAGFILFRSGKLTKEGSRNITNLLVYIAIPSVIINSFLAERTQQKLNGFVLSMVLGLGLLILAILVARLCFPRDEIADFAVSFSNAGFIGIPLITDVLGAEAVFYIAPFIAVLNLLQWTYGVSLLTGEKGSLKLKSVLTAPFMIAIIIGFAIFVSGIRIPFILTQTVSQMAGLNTPLAMFAVGVYLAQVDFKHMLIRKENYMVSLVRLLVIPAVSLLFLTFIPLGSIQMRMALFIAAACPVGANVAVYAQLHNKDYPYAVETVVITTLLSFFTLPLLVFAAGFFW